jgi:chromosome partitioning protein
MKRIVIANQKGGVAKTTTAVNLAWGLALAGHRTLLIDADPQANATFAVLGPKEPKLSTYDLLIHDQPIDTIIRPTKDTNLDILPSHIDLAGAEVELISKVGGQTRLRTKLNEANLPYVYIVIDAPPSLGFLTINALAASHDVLIPVSAGIFALSGIAKLENTITQVRRELNSPDLRISGVLCTMFDNTNVARDALTELQNYFKEMVFHTVIPKNIKLEEAHSRAESIFAYAPDSKGAEAYQDLVKEIMSRG